jgi:hypothetical protein
MQAHCRQGSNLHGGLAELPPPITEECLPVPSLRAPGVNYSPAWVLPADNTYHIETHYTSAVITPISNASADNI